MPTRPSPSPFTLALLNACTLTPSTTTSCKVQTVNDEHVLIDVVCVLNRREYDLLVEEHRPKTAVEELARLDLIGGRRRDQSTPAELEWFDKHPLRHIGDADSDLDVVRTVRDWLVERNS